MPHERARERAPHPVIIEAGHVQVALLDAAPDAAIIRRGAVAGERPSQASGGCVRRRAVVEYYRAVGGLPQRALLGGVWAPDSSGVLHVEVGLSGPWSREPASYRGALGHELVRGLPDEYGATVLRMLLKSGLPSGFLTIDTAAHDPVESSDVAFRAASLLLAAAFRGDGPDEVEMALRAQLEAIRAEPSWPGPMESW